ncbi:MAG: NAD-binding protein [Chloroflexi bacterium]|nr:NAD-binding protein [Chloroflexota bacterium]
MNAIILGAGRTGAVLATSLANAGHNVTVIDMDVANAAPLPQSHIESGLISLLEGDGTRDSTMESAGIRDADLFAALTGNDNINGLAALKAKITYRVMTVVATVWSGDLTSVFESQGVACVNPARLSADSVIANIPQVLQEQSPSREGV